VLPMSSDLRTLSVQNIHVAIRLINDSSRGTSLAVPLAVSDFLSLSSLWNFSYKHSLISYVDDEPAAVAINCTDRATAEAYNFYWGALPSFRNQRIALALAEASSKMLHDDGYSTFWGDSVPERPVRRWRFVRFYPQHSLVDMQATSLNLGPADSGLEIREIDAEVLSEIPLLPGESFHWCQRPAFLHNAASFFQFFGALAGNTLKAYAVVLAQSSNTILWDLRSPDASSAAGSELLRRLLATNYRAPLTAVRVFEQSYAHRLLTTAGFVVTRRFFTLSRDLRTTCSAETGPPSS